MRIQFADPKLPERFWEKVTPEPNTGCWLWIASIRGDGYGQYSFNQRPRSAHRVAYEQLVGAVPKGYELDHLCRIRSCCNPDHLEPVTRRENCHRGLRGKLHTHCPKGHEFTPENTVINNRGHRYCLSCSRATYKPVAQDKRRILKDYCKRGHIRRAERASRKCLECSNQLQRIRRASLCDRDLLGA